MQVVTSVVRKHFYVCIIYILLRYSSSINHEMTELKTNLTTWSRMSSVYIFNNKFFMFKQVILRSVGDNIAQARPCFRSFYIFFFLILNQVGKELHLL
jgi:hypothetical protein